MSVRDYCRQHYWPYLCRTGRHQWEVVKQATRKEDGLERCARCSEEWVIPHYFTFDELRGRQDETLPMIADMLSRPWPIVQDLPCVSAGAA